MKNQIESSLKIIRSLCEHNKTWQYHGGGIDGELILRQCEAISNLLEKAPSRSGERGRITAIIDSGIRDCFYRYCEDNSLPKNKTLEKALIKFING